jgi:hypothetical protein
LVILETDRVSSDSESVGHNDDQEGQIKLPSRGRIRSRSFLRISDTYKDTTLRAAAHVRFYTYFENPMLTPEEITLLVVESWEMAQEETGKTLKRSSRVDAHVSWQLHSHWLGYCTETETSFEVFTPEHALGLCTNANRAFWRYTVSIGWTKRTLRKRFSGCLTKTGLYVERMEGRIR